MTFSSAHLAYGAVIAPGFPVEAPNNRIDGAGLACGPGKDNAEAALTADMSEHASTSQLAFIQQKGSPQLHLIITQTRLEKPTGMHTLRLCG